MSVFRRFLIAPSLARLIRKERGGSKLTEGYFTRQANRISFVRLGAAACHLVLNTTDESGRTSEELTEVPRAHADVLLDVCNGKISFERTTTSVAGQEILIDRYISPAGFDLVSVRFGEQSAADSFVPPVWFGAEISHEPAFVPSAIAIDEVQAPSEMKPSNAALDAVLDLLEPGYAFGRLDKSRAAA